MAEKELQTNYVKEPMGSLFKGLFKQPEVVRVRVEQLRS